MTDTVVENTIDTTQPSVSGTGSIKYGGQKHLGLICPKCNKVFGSSWMGETENPICKHSKQAYLKKIKQKNQEHYEFYMEIEDGDNIQQYWYDLNAD
jgi:hypothetical protein